MECHKGFDHCSPDNSAIVTFFGMVSSPVPLEGLLVTSNDPASKGHVLNHLVMEGCLLIASFFFFWPRKCLPSLKLTAKAPENQWLENDISFWDGLLSEAMLASGSVMILIF